MDRAKVTSLVLKLKEGRKEYFDEFYAQTSAAAFYLAKKYCGASEAEDVMQEAYLSFLANIHKVDPSYNPVSYLLGIVKSKAVDYLRKSGRTDVFDHTQTSELFVSDNYDEGYPLLDRCKKLFGEEDFTLFELIIVYGYKQKEVAKIMNKPLATVNWRYHRLLSRAKAIFKEMQNED